MGSLSGQHPSAPSQCRRTEIHIHTASPDNRVAQHSCARCLGPWFPGWFSNLASSLWGVSTDKPPQPMLRKAVPCVGQGASSSPSLAPATFCLGRSPCSPCRAHSPPCLCSRTAQRAFQIIDAGALPVGIPLDWSLAMMFSKTPLWVENCCLRETCLAQELRAASRARVPSCAACTLGRFSEPPSHSSGTGPSVAISPARREGLKAAACWVISDCPPLSSEPSGQKAPKQDCYKIPLGSCDLYQQRGCFPD